VMGVVEVGMAVFACPPQPEISAVKAHVRSARRQVERNRARVKGPPIR